MAKTGIKHQLWLWALLIPLAASGQEPDFLAEQFYTIANSRNASSFADKISASTRLYSYGKTLSLVVEVKDPRVNIDPDNDDLTDHIEVWFALPASAYPANFEYSFHPDYVASIPEITRSITAEKPRFFSTISEYGSEVSVSDFTSRHDYPRSSEIKKDSLNVPERRSLQYAELPYGVVHFGLFPDGRNVVHYNKKELQLVEDALQIRMGDFVDGIDYIAELHEDEDGYTINARFTPQALGFLKMPELDQIRFMVDIADNGNSPATPANVVISSSRDRIPGKPSTFNSVSFIQPLQTNMTQVPDPFYRQAQMTQLSVYGATDWVNTSVDVDGLVYGNQQVSQSLTEVGFFRQRLWYDSANEEGFLVKRAMQSHDYVNKLPTEREYVQIENQMITADRVIDDRFPDHNDRMARIFRFSDGAAGVILHESNYQDPYGWGECGDCVMENISIRRVTPTDEYDIFSFRQSDGPEPFTEIGEYRFDGFYISKLDWIQKGRILVIRLTDYADVNQERVKLSWAPDGTNLRVEWVR